MNYNKKKYHKEYMKKSHVKGSYITRLDEATSSNLEKIFFYSLTKYINGELKDKPSKIGIVRSLINGLYITMKEDGQL